MGTRYCLGFIRVFLYLTHCPRNRISFLFDEVYDLELRKKERGSLGQPCRYLYFTYYAILA